MRIRSQHPPILSIVGFAVVGMFSFGLVCAALVVWPDILTGDAPRGPSLAAAHLTTLGWISSLLFAGTYLVSPVLAGAPLWSRRLPALHFACHFLGLGLLTGGSATANATVAAAGSGILVFGFLALLLNVYQTGSGRSLWTPSNLAFHSAIFWLIVTGGTALFILRDRLGSELTIGAETMTALHVHYGLFGFLAQVLLAVSLRVVPEMLGEGRDETAAGRMSWIGWILLNGGLLLLIPATQSGWTWPLFAVGLIIAAGMFCFASPLAGMLWLHRRRVSWGELTHATGILFLLAVVVVALATYPGASAGSADELRQWMALYIPLALFGPFAFAFLGVAQRLVPRLVWQLRLFPWSNCGKVPGLASLSRPAAGGPVYFSLLLAWCYLAFGHWTADPEAIRLGGILMLIAVGWFIAGIKPAILRFVVGVTPSDFPQPPVIRPEPAGNQEPIARKSRPVAQLQPLTYG